MQIKSTFAILSHPTQNSYQEQRHQQALFEDVGKEESFITAGKTTTASWTSVCASFSESENRTSACGAAKYYIRWGNSDPKDRSACSLSYGDLAYKVNIHEYMWESVWTQTWTGQGEGKRKEERRWGRGGAMHGVNVEKTMKGLGTRGDVGG